MNSMKQMIKNLHRLATAVHDRVERFRCRNGHEYAAVLRQRDVFAAMGPDCYIDFSVNIEEPYLVRLGKNVWLTDDVRLLTHDASLTMLSRVHGGVLRKFGSITLEDNVFIGMNSTLMPGVRVGTGSVIAAGSVVTRNVPPGSIVGGNPAKQIGSSADLVEKWRTRQSRFAYVDGNEKRAVLMAAMERGAL
jgi:acetyltransferase-like isoleucine patch superfamily enzyme